MSSPGRTRRLRSSARCWLATDRQAPLPAASRQLHISLQRLGDGGPHQCRAEHTGRRALIRVGGETRTRTSFLTSCSTRGTASWSSRSATMCSGRRHASRLDSTNWRTTRRCARTPGRLAQRDRVVSTIANRLTTADSSHWLGALEAAGVPCGVVRSVRDALADVSIQPGHRCRVHRCRAPCDDGRRDSTSTARRFDERAGAHSRSSQRLKVLRKRPILLRRGSPIVLSAMTSHAIQQPGVTGLSRGGRTGLC